MEKTNKQTILKTRGLSIGYRHKKVTSLITENINIELKEGELIGLVGANGIGKSTLLRTLSAIQMPLSGHIEINDIPLLKYTDLELSKQLSLVLTERLMSKNLSVYELVALGRQPYTNWVGNLSKTDIHEVEKAIELTNLSDFKTRKCFELSDGQFQKVLIARALAQDTHLIILDEPTTHLDMYHKAYVLKLLQNLVKETNKTILFSSHEIDLAIQLCDTMLVMTNGNVVSDSPCNLIKQGVFETLFPKDLISFDQHTGSFRVKNN